MLKYIIGKIPNLNYRSCQVRLGHSSWNFDYKLQVIDFTNVTIFDKDNSIYHIWDYSKLNFPNETLDCIQRRVCMHHTDHPHTSQSQISKCTKVFSSSHFIKRSEERRVGKECRSRWS